MPFDLNGKTTIFSGYAAVADIETVCASPLNATTITITCLNIAITPFVSANASKFRHQHVVDGVVNSVA